jgi:hypothetical protein
LEALAHLDPAKAQVTLQAVPSEAGIRAQDIRILVDSFVESANAKAMKEGKTSADGIMIVAIEILKEGQQDYPEWDALIKKTGDAASSLGDPDSITALQSLGYIGDE